ncbi:aldo/keto reductase [Castellaniella hirudinis]|uniref:aldo/keto reductase n=1 Tax=Castellaniella hirudinis TaxID=1144617 RepID=UPI0039C2504F
MTSNTRPNRQTRAIAGTPVFSIGLGCMGLSHGYGPAASAEQAKSLLLAALDHGVTLFDTAALYGFGHNETLLGQVLPAHRSRIFLASKCGLFRGPDGLRRIDGRPDTLRRTCEESLSRLRTETIDLYYLHRWDKSVPIEDSIGALADLVRAGKIRHIGLSEVSAGTLRRAHAVHPIAAVQSEYALWARNVEIGVLRACRDIGAALVAFSPLGRAFLADGLHALDGLSEGDLRRRMPRFQPDALAANLALLGLLRDRARALRCTPGQLALAWLLHQGPDIIPIPGTTQPAHLRENLAAVDIVLDDALSAELSAHFDHRRVAGDRYGPATLREIDTEQFPAASA